MREDYVDIRPVLRGSIATRMSHRKYETGIVFVSPELAFGPLD
jgi:hypothetical protein